MTNVIFLKATPSVRANSKTVKSNNPPHLDLVEEVQPPIENLIFGRYRPAYVKSLLDMTAAELANHLEISIHTWRSYESNKRELTSSMTTKLENLFEEKVAILMQCGGNGKQA